MCTWQHSRIFVFTIAQWTSVHRFFLCKGRSSTAHCHPSAGKSADRAVVTRRTTCHRAVGLSMTVVVSCRCVIAGNTRHAVVCSSILFLACLSCVGFTDNILHSFGLFSRVATTTTTTTTVDKLIIRCTLSNIYLSERETEKKRERTCQRRILIIYGCSEKKVGSIATVGFSSAFQQK